MEEQKIDNNAISDIAEQITNRKKEELKRKEQIALERYKIAKKDFRQVAQEIEAIQRQIKGIKIEDEQKIREQLIEIFKDRRVVTIRHIGDDIIKVELKNLICYEDKCNKCYKIPDCALLMSIGTGEIRFEDAMYSEMRRGWWTKEGDERQIHPHVDHNGKPCLGNATEMLSEMSADENIYGMFIVAANYLESVNIEDCAGQAICHWDECDRNGSIIREGHEVERDEYDEYDEYISRNAHFEYNDKRDCECCGEEIDTEDIYRCEVCGRTICEDCVTYDELLGIYVCKDCIDEYYTRCKNCGTLFNPEKIEYYTTTAGEYYCVDCYDAFIERQDELDEEIRREEGVA